MNTIRQTNKETQTKKKTNKQLPLTKNNYNQMIANKQKTNNHQQLPYRCICQTRLALSDRFFVFKKVCQTLMCWQKGLTDFFNGLSDLFKNKKPV